METRGFVQVLILVVMEDSLWLPLVDTNGNPIEVLILVVMEDSLWLKDQYDIRYGQS